MDLGISALSPTVGLSGLRDPLGEATAALEARRRQQVENGRAPPWMRDIAYGIDNLFQQPLSAFIPPELRDRLPSAEMVGNLVLGALPGSGDYMAARDALESSAASMSALGRGDYMGAGARGIDALAAGLGIMPFLPYLASIKGVGNPIRAYHGSPHDFDRFDMSKIGTGEGAQAYGHGLYFAENEGVARSYRDQLQGATIVWPNKQFESAIESLEPRLRDQFKQWVLSKRPTQSEMRKFLINWADGAEHSYKYFAETGQRGGAGYGADHGRALSEVARNLAAERKMPKAVNSGRMYEVNIHADPERFLDWDAPLSAQPEPVALTAWNKLERALGQPGPINDEVFARFESGSATGKDIVGMFARRDATETLRDAGVPGIKYLDKGSRSAGDGTRNYVVFDDKLIEILRKYGIMAPMAGAGIGSLYMGGEGEGM